MIKYLKYLISFLLVFGLTVNDGCIYSQINSANYHQVSSVNTRKELNPKHSKIFVYTRSFLFEKILSTQLITYRNLQDVFSTQIQIVLKLQYELYQKIDSMKAQHIFLNKIITSSNHYSSLYKA